MRLAIVLASILLVGFHLWTGLFGVLESFTQRSFHLLLVILAAVAIALDPEKNSPRRRFAMAAAGLGLAASLVYNIVFAEHFAGRMAYVVPLDTVSIAMAILGMSTLLIIAIVMMLAGCLPLCRWHLEHIAAGNIITSIMKRLPN